MKRLILTQISTFETFAKKLVFGKNYKFRREPLDHHRMHIGRKFGGNPAPNEDSIDTKVHFDPNFDI